MAMTSPSSMRPIMPPLAPSGRNMADGRAAGRAGEAAVGDERHFLVQLPMPQMALVG